MKFIPLTKGYFAIVDDDDYARLAVFKWHVNKGYACRTNRKISMHRVVLNNFDMSMDIDHVNGNKSDNRKANLRIASRTLNLINRPGRGGTSTFKGVSWSWRQRRWRAQISVNRRKIYLGYFLDEVEAAMAYDAAAKQHCGEFAWTNFP